MVEEREERFYHWSKLKQTKKFAEKLYELDEFGEHQFKKPRQIKGQLDNGSMNAGEKRKQKSDKRKKRKEFIQKKKKQK